MRRYFELSFYVSFGAGMAFGTSSFTMMSGLFEVVTAPWVVLAIILAGLFCAIISSSIAELASMYPSAPGVRTYLKVALPNELSLTLVYLYLIFMVLIAGVESYMFALVVKAVFPGVAPLYVVWGLIAFTVVVNLLGLELPMSLQILSTVILIAGAISVAFYGLWTAPSSQWGNFAGGLQDSGQLRLLPAAIGMAIYLFIGFEWVTMLGFRPDSYKRLIPVSMPLAILTNVIAYSVFVCALATRLTRSQIIASSVPQVPFLFTLLGRAGIYVAWGLSLLAVFSTFNAGIMGGSRLIHVLTREGNLPRWCAFMSSRTGAPIGGILTLGSLSACTATLIVVYHVELLAAVVGSSIVCFVYAAFMWAVLLLRKRQPAVRRSYRTAVHPVIQWSVIGILPIMGVLSLVSQPTLSQEAVVIAIVCVLGAGGFARWSQTRVQTPRVPGS